MAALVVAALGVTAVRAAEEATQPAPAPGRAAEPAAQPAEAAPGDFVELRSADHMRYDAERQVVSARGNVRFGYQDLEVTADNLAADLRANRAVLSGHVALRTKGEEFRGDNLLVHLDTRQWEFSKVRAAISPSYFESGVLAPLYVGARETQGLRDRLLVRGADFTTCDRPHPHYEITARRLRIWPGRKLIADHATVHILGKRVFTLPWFVVSLRQPRRQPIVPVIGASELEGRYIKTLINYALNDNSYGTGHLDYMTRRGFGKGIEHTQSYRRGRSDLYLYQVDDRSRQVQEWTVTGNHQQDLGGGLSLRAHTDIRSDSFYYQPGTLVNNSQLALDHQSGSGHAGLAFDYSHTSGAFDFKRFATALRADERGSRYGFSLDSRYDSNTTGSGQADDLELNNSLELTDRQSRMGARLIVSKRLDLDGSSFTGDNFYQVVDRLPELALETDSYRLHASPLGVPARLQLSVGNFSELPTSLQAYRVRFGYEALPKNIRLGRKTRINTQARFDQYLYGDRDHTAQYVYGGNTAVEQDLGGDWQARVGYLLLEPKGFTPFRFDYVGAYRSTALDLVYRHSQRERALLRTSYDARFNRWSDVIARVEAPLRRNLQLGLSASYDPNRGHPRDLLSHLRFGDYRTAFDLSARYQLEQGRLQRVTGSLDWVATPKWRVQLLTSYDGLQKELVYGEVMVTRNLHCWDVVAYYSLQRDLFRLDFRIKAFDWGRPDYGVGRFGQYVDTSLGEWY